MTATARERGEAFAANLRAFRPAGALAFVAICAASAVFTPAAAALVLLWDRVSRTPWRAIGLVRPGSWLNGLILGIALGLSEKFLLKAIVLPLLGAPPTNAMFGDLSTNPRRALFLVVYVIIGAGFCEELVFRGYLFERLGKLFGQSPAAQGAIVLLSTAFFSGLHYQQGAAGIENAAICGFIAGVVYILNRYRLFTLMIAHATFDLSAIALIYFKLEVAVSHMFFR